MRSNSIAAATQLTAPSATAPVIAPSTGESTLYDKSACPPNHWLFQITNPSRRTSSLRNTCAGRSDPRQPRHTASRTSASASADAAARLCQPSNHCAGSRRRGSRRPVTPLTYPVSCMAVVVTKSIRVLSRIVLHRQRSAVLGQRASNGCSSLPARRDFHRQGRRVMPVVDADGHIYEPEDLWTARMDASRWGDWIPVRVVEDECY